MAIKRLRLSYDCVFLVFELFSNGAMVVCLCVVLGNTERYNVRQAPVTLLKFVIMVLLAEKYHVTICLNMAQYFLTNFNTNAYLITDHLFI